MLNVHPTPTGGSGRRMGFIPSGDRGKDEQEADFVRCYQCGLPNNLRKVQHGDSFDRNKDFIVTTAVELTSGGTQNEREFNDSAAGGCRFCHSMNIEGRNRLRGTVRKPPAGYTGG